jgi:hypothetical protein
MNKIEVRTEAALPADWWRNLAWMLDVLESWLLAAEPSTVRELDAYLRTIGMHSDASLVVHVLGELRDQMGRNWDGRVVNSTAN